MSKQSVRKTLEEFVAQCKEKHGDTYDYSESVYLGSEKKISIKCRTHGEFSQWPNDHRRGRGCAQCSGNKILPEEFLKEMTKKFPLWNFNKFQYNGAKTKSKVICSLHGEFLVRPNDLKFNHGCGECGIDKQQETKIARGIVSNPADKTDYENYRRAVWRESNRNYKLHKEIINPLNLPRSLKYHLDHRYSIQQGWENNVPAEIIGCVKNLQILEGKKNRQKTNKCTVEIYDIFPSISTENTSIKCGAKI